jgi:hypothetical protein
MYSQQGWRLLQYVPVPIPTGNYGLYSQIDASPLIVNDNTEKTLVGAGVGTLSVPANGFSVGDSFVARLGGELSNLNNTNITFKVSSLGVVLVDTGLIQLKASSNQFWQLLVCFTIRKIGGAGVGSIISNGTFTHIRNNTSTEIFGFNTINDLTFDTTIPNTLDITAQWGTASPSNSIHTDYFELNKIY